MTSVMNTFNISRHGNKKINRHVRHWNQLPVLLKARLVNRCGHEAFSQKEEHWYASRFVEWFIHGTDGFPDNPYNEDGTPIEFSVQQLQSFYKTIRAVGALMERGLIPRRVGPFKHWINEV